MKNEKQGCYPTVILWLCCGYHLVRYRYGIENGVEMEWKRGGNGAGMERKRGERKRCGERSRKDRREAKKRKNAEK